MPFDDSTGDRLLWAAATAAHGTSGHAVHPCEPGRPNCQLAEQVLRYLPPRQIPGPIASGSRGAVIRTSLSGFAGGSGGAQIISGKQEVRQMLECASYLPAVVEPLDPHAVIYVKDI